jgi:imidazolonepropionase-like amidohydrolase
LKDISNANIIPANKKKMRKQTTGEREKGIGMFSLLLCILCFFPYLLAQKPASTVYLLKPAQVFDGESVHAGWMVLVRDDRIAGAGPAATVRAPAEAKIIDLAGTTLMPGLIEAHSHVLLHPYNETSWNDQNAHESLALRVARATVHLQRTLMAGFTTIRDLGTEGAAYADAGLKEAVEQGIVPGPRMIVVTRAIVATGSYGPKGFAAEWTVPQGAEEASGNDVIRVVRDQIGHGADWRNPS